MNVYTNRLNTYSHRKYQWPYIGDAQYDTPEQFAKAGFYSLSTKKLKDKVQCYMCGIVLNDWKAGESPMERHARASSSCAVVILNYPDAHIVNTTAEAHTNTGLDSELMAFARLETFTKNNVWPPGYGDKKRCTRSTTKLRTYPSASKMVEAGFVFAPTLDQPDLSICSCCGFYLCDFSGHHDIWTQHRNHSLHCLFIERWQAKADSIESPIVQEQVEAADDLPTSLDRTPIHVIESAKHNGPPTTTDENAGDSDGKNSLQQHSVFDDSIWDIATVQLKNNRHDWTTERNSTTYTTTTPRITYGRKKRKRSPKILSSGHAKQSLVMPSSEQPKSTKQITPMRHDLTNLLEKPKETTAQLFLRLQKRPNRSYTSQEKAKGRALDIMETTPTYSKRLNKNSLRLSTSKNLDTKAPPGTSKTTASLSSSSSVLSTPSSSSHTNIIIA